MGIQMEGINFSYGDKKVLKDINLSIQTGEHIGIIGFSGCGKSTLLKLISGLYIAREGYIEVEGDTNPIQIRRHIALVMQNTVLLPLSIKENITCGHSYDDEIIKQACEVAQLTEWIATLPGGIDTLVGERNGNISGGQAQRIAIARALAKAISLTEMKSIPKPIYSTKPNEITKTNDNTIKNTTIFKSDTYSPVLILDEATSALDSDTSNAVLMALKNLTKNMTVITVTHRPEALIDVNQLYRLEEGILVHA
ncbi:ATP-binding cassette domain-containing protein [Clostridium sp. Marseille-P299]|uniref:ATP-binding cassette domain-containing protein n=1 Tax=Clostridium sp. Marseille-P299 TaxID=1805477 RepID=UPI00082E5D3C|nr:ATP-binding cassette domain-containing protein [Clostridium sp. Marseille-P299]